jgi:hypothetical protein
MNIATQAKSQLTYMSANKGKVIGSGVGLTAGILYGLSNSSGKWGVVGFALLGVVVGGLIGQMVDANGSMKQISTGDSQNSQFRGYTRRGTEINRPFPRSAMSYKKTGLRKNMIRRNR